MEMVYPPEYGHPSAAGRAQDRESSPVRDRRFTTVPRHQLGIGVGKGKEEVKGGESWVVEYLLLLAELWNILLVSGEGKCLN